MTEEMRTITRAADARARRDEIAGGVLPAAFEAVEAKIRELEEEGLDEIIVHVPESVSRRVADAYSAEGWTVGTYGDGDFHSLRLALPAAVVGAHPSRTQPDGSPVLDFWSFVHERMLVWDRKVNLGQPRPWTDDPVLRDRFFTNIFRDLDPGTKVAEKIVSRDRPAWERLWNLMMYRRFNREETWDLIDYHEFGDVDDMYDVSDVQAHLRDLYLKLARHRAESGLPLWTDAHQVFPMPNIGGPADVMSRFFRVQLDLFDPDRAGGSIYELADRLGSAETRKQAFKALMDAKIPGVSSFLSWQLTMDCTYGPRPIVTADDDWAPITTGARTGAIMWKEWPRIGTVNYPADGWEALPPTPPARLEAFVRELEERQDEEFVTRGLDFAAFGRRLDMPALEHALCEFSKYVAAAVGMPTRDRWAQAGGGRGTRRAFDESAPDVVAAVEAIAPGTVGAVESVKGPGQVEAGGHPGEEPKTKKAGGDARPPVGEDDGASAGAPSEPTSPAPAPRVGAETRFREAVRAVHRRGVTPTSRLIFEELGMRSVSLNSRQAEWRRDELARLGYRLENGNYVLPYGRREEDQ